MDLFMGDHGKMKQRNRLAAAVLAALFIALLLFAAYLNLKTYDPPSPKAVSGSLDLSGWHPGQGGQIIDLQGEWEFYWGDLLTYQDGQAASDF